MKKLFFALLLMMCAAVPAWADGASVRGDVNGDGEVNPADIAALIDYLLNDTYVIVDGDVNRDGVVSTDDIAALIDYLLTGDWPAPDGETFTINGVTFTVKYVDGGTFMMGATDEQMGDADDDEMPAHQVTVSDYAIGKTEVTQQLWQAVMGYNPSNNTGDLRRPVEMVSWNDCQEFVAELSELTGRNFRLPTEAEWEYAARGGNKSHGYKYAGGNTIDDVAWYKLNSDNQTGPVAAKAPNELGLYDMSGNVFEWCQDWFGMYTDEPQVDPTGTQEGEERVRRGGCFSSNSGYCRVSSRNSNSAMGSIRTTGLRVVLALDPTPVPKVTDVMDFNTVIVTATGEGDVTLYVNGEAVSNPYIAPRGEEAYTITARASAKAVGMKTTFSHERTITVPRMAPSTDTITVNGVDFTMILVDGGTFTMGATPEQAGEAWEEEMPDHQVTLSDFAIGQTEVTQELWQAVMGSNPSHFTGDLQRPVEMVSWNDCQEFITRLNELTGKYFRLPTEAEWEFAARGGLKSQGCKYAGSNTLADVAWYAGYSDGTTHPVATKAPNELNLYDMSGNVFEWCHDWCGDYTSEAQTDPFGPDEGGERVRRGGCFSSSARYCRVSYRGSLPSMESIRTTGLRLVMELEPTPVPVVNTVMGENTVTISAEGEGIVILYVNGESVQSPYVAQRGEESYTVTAQASARLDGMKTTRTPERTVVVPRLVAQSDTMSVNGVTFTMVTVEGGTFLMGATPDQGPDAISNTKPVHQVTVSGFAMGQTEVTQELWQAVMGSNPSQFADDPQRPVEMVSWEQCQEFIAQLNQLTGKHFRLPTEAEWEYAARGGNMSLSYMYAGSNNADEVAWQWHNRNGTDPNHPDYGTHTVAALLPNELGLYDMSGNVEEWCQDWYKDDYYTEEPQVNPTGPERTGFNVIRGGCWYFPTFMNTVSFRAANNTNEGNNTIGLRLVLDE